MEKIQLPILLLVAEMHAIDKNTQTGAHCALWLLPAGMALGKRRWRLSRSACHHEGLAADAACMTGTPSLSQRCFFLHCSAAVTTQRTPAVGNPSDPYMYPRHGDGAPLSDSSPPRVVATWLLELMAIELPAFCPCTGEVH